VRCVSPLIRRVIDLDPDPGSIQKINYLFRLCKKIGQEYDFCVTADMMEADFGVPGLQYIHYPWLGRLYHQYRRARETHARPLLLSLLRREVRPWMLISDYSFERMKRNVTLVNSDWTSRKVQEAYNIKPITVYPPVPGVFPDVPWEERENGFVCIGRLSPYKRFDWIVEMLDGVRRITPDLQLHIVGTPGQVWFERAYYRCLCKLVQANASWVHIHEDLSRADLVQLVARQRYGIHAQFNEHFGIAAAEMLRAGCITFVHDSGGQVEIVGREAGLTYQNAEDARQRITAILTSPERQAEIRRVLAERKERFSPQRFVREIQDVVRQLHNGNGFHSP
jgi:glycosyltransferase involved in cell wall biosynthesis